MGMVWGKERTKGEKVSSKSTHLLLNETAHLLLRSKFPDVDNICNLGWSVRSVLSVDSDD